MRSLLVITAAIAFLAAYLEAMSPNGAVNSAELMSHKVVRDHKLFAHKPQPISNTPSVKHTQKPLDLSVPNQISFQTQLNEHKSIVADWFKPKDEAEITYNAELVFDIDKGENITGGKVNIKIPLS